MQLSNSQGKKNPGSNCQFMESFLDEVRMASEMNIDRYCFLVIFSLDLMTCKHESKWFGIANKKLQLIV